MFTSTVYICLNSLSSLIKNFDSDQRVNRDVIKVIYAPKHSYGVDKFSVWFVFVQLVPSFFGFAVYRYRFITCDKLDTLTHYLVFY